MKIIRIIDTSPPAPELDLRYFLDFEKQQFGFAFTVTGKYRSDLSADVKFDDQKFKFYGPVKQEVGYSHYGNAVQYDFFRERYIDGQDFEYDQVEEEINSPDAVLSEILKAESERMIKSIFRDY